MDDRTRKILIRASELVKGGWLQCQSAANSKGKQCYAIDPSAVAFCVDGAIQRAAHEYCNPDNDSPEECLNDMNFLEQYCASAKDARNAIDRAVGYGGAMGWNDANGQSQENVWRTLEKVAKSIYVPITVIGICF